MKSILLKILSIISPVIILAVLGIMQGVWFDVEESLLKEEIQKSIIHLPFNIYCIIWQV